MSNLILEGVQIPWLDSNFQNRNQFSITSGQGWLGPMLCTVKWEKKVCCGGVFDLAVEQPQLFRKQNKNKNSEVNFSNKYSSFGLDVRRKSWF